MIKIVSVIQTHLFNKIQWGIVVEVNVMEDYHGVVLVKSSSAHGGSTKMSKFRRNNSFVDHQCCHFRSLNSNLLLRRIKR